MPNYKDINENISPLSFQLKALNKISKFISLQNNQSFLVNFPMGAGKSHMISLISQLENGTVLIITPSIEIKYQLLKQSSFFKSEYNLSEKEIITIDDKDLNLKKVNIIFTTFQGLFSIYQNNREYYNSIQKAISFILIDEGHREPSSQWSYVVRKIKKPKILFTATPYRNDFNIFEIEDHNVEIQTYNELKDFKKKDDEYLLRDVHFDQGDWGKGNCEDFLREFFNKFKEVCNKPFLKAIIRCDQSSSIEKLVLLINEQEAGLAVGVHTGYDRSVNHLGLYEHYSGIPKNVLSEARIFIHQFKLIEGIDDKNLILLALFDPFVSARALIQQIGRILRFKDKRKAVVLESNSGIASKMWNDYLEFDKELSLDKKMWGVKKFSTEYSKNINKILYENTDFKSLLEIGNLGPDILKKLTFDKKIYLYKCSDEFNLTDAIDLLDSDFLDTYKLIKFNSNQIKKNLTHPDVLKNSYLFLYVEVQNSKVLGDLFFPEVSINIAGFFQIRETFFFYNSGRGKPKTLLESGLISTFSNSELEVLYGRKPVFSNLSLSNLDISDTSMRQRTVRATNLNDIMSSNLDYSFYVNNSVYKDVDSRKYLGFSSSRYSEFSSKNSTISSFVVWLDELHSKLGMRKIKNQFLKRFARAVEPLKNAVPIHVLIDVLQSESYQNEEFDQDLISLLQDTTEKAYVVIKQNGKYIIQFKLKDETFPLMVFRKKDRYYLKLETERDDLLDDLDEEIKLERAILIKLLREINRKNLFRLTFEKSKVVYAGGKYFEVNNLEVLSEIIFPDPNLLISLSEKGEHLLTVVDTPKWEPSIFKYISDYNPKVKTSALYSEMGNLDYMICDDDSDEIADFILLQNNNGVKKIIFMVCKSKVDSNNSVTALYDVSAQALKNLNFLNPLADLSKIKDGRFSGYRAFKKPKSTFSYKVKRLKAFHGNAATHDSAFKLYEQLLRDPNTIKEVWLVIGGGFVGHTFKQELKKAPATQAYYIIQAQYLLLSTWAGVSSANVRLKVFC